MTYAYFTYPSRFDNHQLYDFPIYGLNEKLDRIILLLFLNQYMTILDYRYLENTIENLMLLHSFKKLILEIIPIMIMII